MVSSKFNPPKEVAEAYEAIEDLGIPWDAFLVTTVAERDRIQQSLGATDDERALFEEALTKDIRKLQVSREDWNATIKKSIPPAMALNIGQGGGDSDGEELTTIAVYPPSKHVDATRVSPSSSAATAAADPVVGVVVKNELAKEFGSLKNQASTCYLNALIQALFHIPYFRQAIYMMQIPPGTEPKDSIPLALQRLFCLLQSKQLETSTVELTSAFGWTTDDAAVQHDIHELARKLLDVLDEQMAGTAQADKIKKLFQGSQIFYTRCLDADYTSKREQVFYDVELVVKDHATLVEALESYTRPERLDGKIYKWEHEDGTSTLHEAERGVCFKSLPPVLMIHPNRLDFCMRTFQRISVLNAWGVPMEIDMAKYIDPDLRAPRREGSTGPGSSEADQPAAHGDASAEWKRESSICVDSRMESLPYVLHSIVIHSGGATSGHYFCYVRFGDQWLKFNDELVTVETEATVMDDAVGGESTYRDRWGYTVTTPKVKKASLLMYVSKESFSKIIYEMPSGLDALPAHLRTVVEEAKERDRLEAERKAAEARLVEVTAIIEDSAGMYLGAMRDATLRRTLKFDKEATGAQMREQLAAEIGVPAAQLRLWKYHMYFGSSYYRRAGDETLQCEAEPDFTAFFLSPDHGKYYNYHRLLFVQIVHDDVAAEGGGSSLTADEPQKADAASDAQAPEATAAAKAAAAADETTSETTSAAAASKRKADDSDDDAPFEGATTLTITEETAARPCLLHVTEFDGTSLRFRGTVSSLGELKSRYIAAGKSVVVRYVLEKEVKKASSLYSLISGDAVILADPKYDDATVTRVHDRAHNSLEVTLFRLTEDFTGEEVGTIQLGGTMKVPDIQHEIFEMLKRRRDAATSEEERSAIVIPESPEYIGIRNHDINADLPNWTITHTNTYYYDAAWRKNPSYDRTVTSILTTGGYIMARLYYEILPVKMADIDELKYFEVAFPQGERKNTHMYIDIADKPTWQMVIDRIHEAGGIPATTDVRVVERYSERYMKTFTRSANGAQVFKLDHYSHYFVDVLPQPVEGVSIDEQHMYEVRHVSRQSGEDYFGYPTMVYYTETDSGESLMRRILAKLDVAEDQVDACLKNWRLLINDGYSTRVMINAKDNVNEIVEKARATGLSAFFMLDHPMPNTTARKKGRYAERELVIKAKSSTSPVPESPDVPPK